MADDCPGSVIFFALRGDDPVILNHRRAGGRAIFVRHDTVIIAEGDVEIPLVALEYVPLTHGGRIAFQVENTLAAAAAAWALGISRDAIRAGLESFAADTAKVPGRFNLLEIDGATVIVDYGHNVSALAALIEALENFPPSRRTIVYSAAGDRRDCDMVRQGELLGQAFDRVILYEDHYLRGRAEGEIMRLFRDGLSRGKRVGEVQEFRGNIKAIESALSHARGGELLVVQADMIDETMEFLHKYLATRGARPRDRSLGRRAHRGRIAQLLRGASHRLSDGGDNQKPHQGMHTASPFFMSRCGSGRSSASGCMT